MFFLALSVAFVVVCVAILLLLAVVKLGEVDNFLEFDLVLEEVSVV